MKYIIFDNRTPVIFPETIDHDNMAAFLRRNSRGLLNKETSAGFIHADGEGDGYAHGESVTLDLKSGKNDMEIIGKAMSHY